MKSTPAAHRLSTSSAVCGAVRPMLGLMMVPISGRPKTFASWRVPSIPNEGPPKVAAYAGGRSKSSRRSPVTSPSSNRLPAIVASRLGRLAPTLSTGKAISTCARWNTPACGRRSTKALGSVGSSTGGRGSIRTTRARERALSSWVSPGSAMNVPLDCSPAMTCAAFSEGTELSTK